MTKEQCKHLFTTFSFHRVVRPAPRPHIVKFSVPRFDEEVSKHCLGTYIAHVMRDIRKANVNSNEAESPLTTFRFFVQWTLSPTRDPGSSCRPSTPPTSRRSRPECTQHQTNNNNSSNIMG